MSISLENVIFYIYLKLLHYFYYLFLNIQNSGLANDGAGDLKFYYDRVEANERGVITDAYCYLDDILTRSFFGNELELSFEFKSLFQMTPEQESVIRNRDAETNQIYANLGIMNEIEIKEIIAQDPYFVSITPESVELEKEMQGELETGAKEFESETEI